LFKILRGIQDYCQGQGVTASACLASEGCFKDIAAKNNYSVNCDFLDSTVATKVFF
jgi:hypothetical protein